MKVAVFVIGKIKSISLKNQIPDDCEEVFVNKNVIIDGFDEAKLTFFNIKEKRSIIDQSNQVLIYWNINSNPDQTIMNYCDKNNKSWSVVVCGYVSCG